MRDAVKRKMPGGVSVSRSVRARHAPPKWEPNETNFIVWVTQKKGYNGANGHTCMGCKCGGTTECGEPPCGEAVILAAPLYNTMRKSHEDCPKKTSCGDHRGYNCSQLSPTLLEDVGLHSYKMKSRILGFTSNDWASNNDRRMTVAVGIESEIPNIDVVNALLNNDTTPPTNDNRTKMNNAIGRFCLNVESSPDCAAGTKCPIMLQNNSSGTTCRKWHLSDSYSRRDGDNMIKEHCAEKDFQYWCDCVSRNSGGGRLNTMYHKLLELKGVENKNTKCWFTPCRGQEAIDGGRLVQSNMMHSKSEKCKLPDCGIAKGLGGFNRDQAKEALTCNGDDPFGEGTDDDDNSNIVGIIVAVSVVSVLGVIGYYIWKSD